MALLVSSPFSLLFGSHLVVLRDHFLWGLRESVWGARGKTQVGCMQNKCLTHCTIFVAGLYPFADHIFQGGHSRLYLELLPAVRETDRAGAPARTGNTPTLHAISLSSLLSLFSIS